METERFSLARAVEQHEQAKIDLKIKEVEQQVAKAQEQYDANVETAGKLELKEELEKTAANLLSTGFRVATVHPSFRPEFVFLESDKNKPNLCSTSEYYLSLIWSPHSSVDRFSLSVITNGEEVSVISRYYPKNGKKELEFRRNFQVEGINLDEMHQTLFDAYKFATDGPEKGEPVS